MKNEDKFFGIPSLTTFLLGGSLLLYSNDVNNDYNKFITSATENTPIIRQVNIMDSAISHLYSAEKALNYLPLVSGKVIIIMPPNTETAVEKLKKARTEIIKEDLLKNYEVRTIDDQIRITEREISKLPDGQSESFYEPVRIQIKGIEDRAEEELNKLRLQVPKDILEERDSRIGNYKFFNTFGLILGLIGGICSVAYGSIKLLNKHYGL